MFPESKYIAAIQLDRNYLLFIPESTSYISAKSVLQAFASLYSISRGYSAAKITKTEFEERNGRDSIVADVITYGDSDESAPSLTRGSYRSY